MDFIISESRIKCGEPGQEDPDADFRKKITKLLHGC